MSPKSRDLTSEAVFYIRGVTIRTDGGMLVKSRYVLFSTAVDVGSLGKSWLSGSLPCAPSQAPSLILRKFEEISTAPSHPEVH